MIIVVRPITCPTHPVPLGGEGVGRRRRGADEKDEQKGKNVDTGCPHSAAPQRRRAVGFIDFSPRWYIIAV